MCGIVGLYYFDADRNVDPADLRRMNDAIRHRGPDDAGSVAFGPFGMAMRRLSIIDVAGGRQPIANENDTVWVVMNGEIYNFRELRRDLQEKGHRFRSGSDTEVAVHAYEEFGEAFVERLEGMFALALWDARAEKLLLARDRLGIKPLFYFSDARGIAFASETKALLALPELPRELDLEALDAFLTLEYTLAPRTLLQNVRKLRPGHVLTVQRGRIQERRYWAPSPVPRVTDPREAAVLLRDRLREAVRSHLVSDVPLGAFLSGGIDSSIIVGLMSELSSSPVKTFSIGFEDASYNELEYARLVAARFGTDHEEHILRPDPTTFLDGFIRYLDEPIGDVSIFPTHLVSVIARRKVKVALSGDGGDELFGGYDTYLADRMERTARRFVPGAFFTALQRGADRFPPARQKKGMVNRVKRFAEGAVLPAWMQHYRWMIFLTETDRRALYTASFLGRLGGRRALEGLRDRFKEVRPSGDRLNAQSAVDLSVYLAENILPKVDVASMAASLEVRVPFLDRAVVETALSLAGDLKIRGFERKVILKEAFRDLLPPEITGRRKEGFSIPLKNWLRRELRDALRTVLNEAVIRDMGLFEWATVARLIQEHVEGRRNHAHRLWCLMVFHLWHEKFMRAAARQDTPAELCAG